MKNNRILLIASLLIGVLVAHLTSFSQAVRRPDQIVRYDNTVIEALISEINETSIAYRKVAAPQGPLYQVKKTEVSYVRYTNGDVERFDGKGAKPTAKPLSNATAIASRKQPAAPARSAPKASSGDVHTRFGITVGGGGGFWRYEKENSDMALSLRGGITAEIPLGSRIALAPSVEFLRFSRKEGAVTTALNFGVVTLAIVPLYNEAKSVNLFYSIGGYGAYGINVTGDGESASFKDSFLSPIHVGADLKLGARFSQNLTVYAQGDYGITTMIDKSLSSALAVPTVSQVTFGVGLRYFFGK